MSILYKIRKVDKDNDSDDYWQELYDYIKKCSEIRGVDFIDKPLNEFKSSYLLWLNNGGASYLVWKKDKPSGYFGYDVFHKEDTEKRLVDFSNRLFKSSLDEELSKEILKCFLTYDQKAQFFRIKSENGESDFIPSLLEVEANDFRGLYKFSISTVNKEELTKSLNTYRNKYPDYSLKFYETLPGEVMKSYCELFVELVREIPGNPNAASYKLEVNELKSSQESAAKNNVYELSYLLYDQQNKLIGFTSLGINKNNPETGYQHLTGITKNYRGKGLGKYLKVAMLLKLLNSYPDLKKLETEIHGENEMSIGMNESIGFVMKGYRKVFLISREKVERMLRASDHLALSGTPPAAEGNLGESDLGSSLLTEKNQTKTEEKNTCPKEKKKKAKPKEKNSPPPPKG